MGDLFTTEPLVSGGVALGTFYLLFWLFEGAPKLPSSKFNRQIQSMGPAMLCYPIAGWFGSWFFHQINQFASWGWTYLTVILGTVAGILIQFYMFGSEEIEQDKPQKLKATIAGMLFGYIAVFLIASLLTGDIGEDGREFCESSGNRC